MPGVDGLTRRRLSFWWRTGLALTSRETTLIPPPFHPPRFEIEGHWRVSFQRKAVRKRSLFHVTCRVICLREPLPMVSHGVYMSTHCSSFA